MDLLSARLHLFTAPQLGDLVLIHRHDGHIAAGSPHAPTWRSLSETRVARAPTEHNALAAVAHAPPQTFPAVGEALREVLAVDEAELRTFGDEEGDGCVESADEEVDGKVVVKVLRRPELGARRGQRRG